MIALSVSFAITALLYATVGFGGGSTYNALLALAGVDYKVLPAIALTCNMIVVAGGSWKFLRAGHVKWPVLIPFLLTSIPAAMIGGVLHISETFFIGVLAWSLLFTGSRMILRGQPEGHPIQQPQKLRLFALGLPIGAVLGLLAGIVGIGGGVFLAPILHYLGWATQKGISGSCSVFILVNSAAGLVGQLVKLHGVPDYQVFQPYLWLFIAVLVGGQIGSHLGVNVLGARALRRLTGILVFYVSLRLLYRWIGLL